MIWDNNILCLKIKTKHGLKIKTKHALKIKTKHGLIDGSKIKKDVNIIHNSNNNIVLI